MKFAAAMGLLLISLPALADRLPLPTGTPASYKAECGSCHLPFPPALLVARDWQGIMNGLDRHFGTDATLEAAQAREIGAFLASHAGNTQRVGSGGNPPRITQTPRFVRKHREIPPRFWSDPRIKSAANCEACHRGAASGNYGEHDIAIPELRE